MKIVYPLEEIILDKEIKVFICSGSNVGRKKEFVDKFASDEVTFIDSCDVNFIEDSKVIMPHLIEWEVEAMKKSNSILFFVESSRCAFDLFNLGYNIYSKDKKIFVYIHSLITFSNELRIRLSYLNKDVVVVNDITTLYNEMKKWMEYISI